MEKFKQWLAMQEMAPTDDEDPSLLHKIAKHPLVAPSMQDRPAIAATAIANTSAAVADQLKKAMYGQQGGPAGYSTIGKYDDTSPQMSGQVEIEIPVSEAANFPRAKLNIARQVWAGMKKTGRDKTADIGYIFVAKLPQRRPRYDHQLGPLVKYPVQIVDRGMGQKLWKTLSMGQYEKLFTKDIVQQMRDRELAAIVGNEQPNDPIQQPPSPNNPAANTK